MHQTINLGFGRCGFGNRSQLIAVIVRSSEVPTGRLSHSFHSDPLPTEDGPTCAGGAAALRRGGRRLTASSCATLRCPVGWLCVQGWPGQTGTAHTPANGIDQSYVCGAPASGHTHSPQSRRDSYGRGSEPPSHTVMLVSARRKTRRSIAAAGYCPSRPRRSQVQ